MRLSASFAQHRLLGGAFVLAVTQAGASLAGLIRDRMLTKTFPGLDTVDVYIASFRPSDLLFQIAIMAGLSTVLVPLLARYKADDRFGDMSGLLSSVIALGSIVFGVIALVLAIIFPWIAPYMVSFKGETLQLYINFGRLALLTNFLFVAGNAFGQYLITVQRYWIYGITPILYTVGTIAGTIWLTPMIGQYGPMIGTLCGAIVYVLYRIVGSLYTGFHFKPVLWHEDIRKMGLIMLPRMLALGALQLELLLFDTIASGLPEGSVTINAYARNFQSVLVGVIGIAVAQSAFSLLSQTIAKGDTKRFWVYMRKGVISLLALTIPGAIILVFCAPIAAYLVHLTSVLQIFGLCLFFYAFSIPFESLNHLVLRAYYSMHITSTPAIFSVFNGVLAIATAWILAPQLGVYAIAIGYTLGQGGSLLGLALLLPRTVRKTVPDASELENVEGTYNA
ncbi:MAG TPA: lipid II flippase MurJ [Candidatus Peribacteraceae bacterium]|nr:lipid II flippase MurJ [Candidatus Peribacteraceae bacterium]